MRPWPTASTVHVLGANAMTTRALATVLITAMLGCPGSTTPDVLTLDDARKANETQSVTIGSGKGWRYHDGCNTTTCVGSFCTMTLVNCHVDDSQLVERLPPCNGEPLKKGEACSFDVTP